MRHHRAAIRTIIAALALDLAAGLLFSATDHVSIGLGLYWAVCTAVTVGYGDIVPHTVAGHILAVLVFITVVPLFAATLSLFTSSLTGTHVRKARDEIREHVDSKLDPGAHHDKLAEKLERLADSHDELTKTVRALVNPLRAGEEQRADAAIRGESPIEYAKRAAPRKPRVRKTTATAGENT